MNLEDYSCVLFWGRTHVNVTTRLQEQSRDLPRFDLSPTPMKKPAPLLLHWLGALLATALLAPLTALADGAIAGSIKEAERGDLLQGASVRIVPGGLETGTDRTGEFYFPRLSAGSYTLEASYLGRATKTST